MNIPSKSTPAELVQESYVDTLFTQREWQEAEVDVEGLQELLTEIKHGVSFDEAERTEGYSEQQYLRDVATNNAHIIATTRKILESLTGKKRKLYAADLLPEQLSKKTKVRRLFPAYKVRGSRRRQYHPRLVQASEVMATTSYLIPETRYKLEKYPKDSLMLLTEAMQRGTTEHAPMRPPLQVIVQHLMKHFFRDKYYTTLQSAKSA